MIEYHDFKQSGEERSFHFTTLKLYSIPEGIRAGTQGRDPEAGTEAETTEEHCLLASYSWLARPDFLERAGPLAQG